jgi:hypothetical protein
MDDQSMVSMPDVPHIGSMGIDDDYRLVGYLASLRVEQSKSNSIPLFFYSSLFCMVSLPKAPAISKRLHAAVASTCHIMAVPHKLESHCNRHRWHQLIL